MNTRRRTVQAKPTAPSVHWHIMHEAYHTMFIPVSHEHVEYWYNIGATGVQRDLFRSICAEIYAQDPNKPDPHYAAEYTEIVSTEEARLMIKFFGRLLTEEEGKRKARVWILHVSNRRRRDNFRDVFAGCQTVFEKRSVMHTDYVHPESEAYPTDRTHYQRSVDWTSLKARKSMQELQEKRADAIGDFLSKRPSTIVAERRGPVARFTKPKNQFDGVNVLSSLGYEGVPIAVAVEELKARREAQMDTEQYYMDVDGSTVYRAGGAPTGKKEAASKCSGILDSVSSDPMTRWKVKICE